MKPLVSFCIITYNQENYILDALNGAVNQDYENLEIIVSDDCSKDNTFDVIENFVKTYQGRHKIILNRNPINLGIAKHCNKVLYELAQGDYILIAGGDDVSHPQRASMSVDYFYKFPQIKSLSFLSEQTDMNLKPTINYEQQCSVHNYSIFTLDDYLSYYDFRIFSGDSRALRREVIDKFPPLSEAHAEDIFLFFRSLLLGSICYIREPMVKRRIHNSNVSLRQATADGIIDFRLQMMRDLAHSLNMGYIPKFLEPRIINKIDQMYRNLEYWALKRNITFKDRVLNKLRKIFKKR